uniref:Calcium uniporter protein n=1 Tax=Petromyzon marinus TaxID=7757 RepID=S4RKC7_PETMA|nr:calcium uniporter protein, mitochondrial [Petromyzon marinus]
MAAGGGRFLASRLSLSCRRALAAAAADFSAKSPLLGFVPRQAPIAKHFPLWRFCPVACSSSVVSSDEVTVSYANGLPVVSITLPSRKERCQFTLRPVLENVGDFLRSLQAEDRGIDRAAIYTLDGTRVAASTGVDILLLDDFKLVINEESYLVQPPKRGSLSADDATALGEVKVLVQQMYTTLRIEEHQLQRERELLTKLDNLRVQIEPLEKVKRDLKLKAEKRTRLVLWGGLAYMATQFGFLARLTWWEYSWDIMEPVTYFVTYGSAIAMYAYFILTRQEYIYQDARDRQYLHFFHRHAEKTRFDFAAYNKLKDDIAQAELDLKRLRDPLQLHLPTPQLEGKH